MHVERIIGFTWLCAVLLLGAARAQAEAPSLLPIQGYLAASETSVTPAPGTPLEGVYPIRFRLYDAATLGNVLHDETLDVTVVKGYFTIYLGDVGNGGNALDLSTFRAYGDVFLGIKVDTDAEATPRLQLAPAAFAAHATYCSEATTLDGKVVADFATAGHTHGYASLTGIPASFTPSAHTHSYASLTSIPASFTPSAHTHAATDVTSGTLDPARYSAYADLTAEGYLDNNASGDLLTQSQGDGRYLALSGGTMTGNLTTSGSIVQTGATADVTVADDLTVGDLVTAQRYAYPASQTRYLSIPAVAFTSYAEANYPLYTMLPYRYTTASGLYAHAPVNLPQAAVITNVTCYWFYNTGTYTLQQRYCSLYRSTSGSTTTTLLAGLATSTPAADVNVQAQSVAVTTNNVVDNQSYSYFVYGNSYTLSSNLNSATRLYGARVTYTVNQPD